MAVAQALLGIRSKARWLRFLPKHLPGAFPYPPGRYRPTVKRSDLAGWAGYGYCSSHTRFFRGLRPRLICTPPGLPIAWSLANAKIDDRQVLAAALEDTLACLPPAPAS